LAGEKSGELYQTGGRYNRAKANFLYVLCEVRTPISFMQMVNRPFWVHGSNIYTVFLLGTSFYGHAFIAL
jgi:hypothetical protein